jgi:hypothetical protein
VKQRAIVLVAGFESREACEAAHSILQAGGCALAVPDLESALRHASDEGVALVLAKRGPISQAIMNAAGEARMIVVDSALALQPAALARLISVSVKG